MGMGYSVALLERCLAIVLGEPSFRGEDEDDAIGVGGAGGVATTTFGPEIADSHRKGLTRGWGFKGNGSFDADVAVGESFRLYAEADAAGMAGGDGLAGIGASEDANGTAGFVAVPDRGGDWTAVAISDADDADVNAGKEGLALGRAHCKGHWAS
jgi:hypothetical protein